MNFHSIRFRLALSFMLLIIIPVLITVSTIYIKSNRIISNKIEESIYNNIDQVKVNIDDVLDNAKETSNVFILNDDLKKILEAHMHVDSPSDFSQIMQITNLLGNLTRSSKDIDSIYVYDTNDNMLISSSGNVVENTDFSKSEIYDEAVRKGRFGQWIINKQNQTMYSSQNNDYVTYVMPIMIYEEEMQVGYVFINVNELTIYKYLNNVTFNGNGSMMVANGRGEIISYKDKSYLGKNKTPDFYYKGILLKNRSDFPLKTDNGETSVYMEESDDSGLYYFALVPNGSINGEITTLRDIAIIVCILNVFFAFLISAFVIKGIYVPINRLVGAMGSLVFRPEFDYFIQEKRKDEFGLLYKSFNSMVSGMRQLFDQLFQEKLKKKEAQLKFLQAQINPHFLYNTLNSIYYISKLHGVDEITELSYSLTNFFRISLSGGLESITVKEMLDQIKYYVRIQNIRYQNRFELSIDVDQQLMGHSVLKFLLQPLVENSIIHGMKNQEDKGLIEITGYRFKDCIKFTVSDDGVGIPQGDLERINATLSQASEEMEGSDAFALSNIHRRMKLFYGDKYGLRIFSTQGQGTVVEVILPCSDEKGEVDV